MSLPKLSIEHVDHDNYCFTCECIIGTEPTADRVVTEDELAAHLGARNLDNIPMRVESVDHNGELVVEEFTADFEHWQECNDLTSTLEDILNTREGRTKSAPHPTKLPDLALLPNLGAKHFLQNIKAA